MIIFFLIIKRTKNKSRVINKKSCVINKKDSCCFINEKIMFIYKQIIFIYKKTLVLSFGDDCLPSSVSYGMASSFISYTIVYLPTPKDPLSYLASLGQMGHGHISSPHFKVIARNHHHKSYAEGARGRKHLRAF